jgi:predicted transcriptional regulator
MSLPELSQIQNRRKMLGITQKQLAKEAEVSQSLIAKIEAGTVQPNYVFTKRIFETLTRLENEKLADKEKTAEEIMTKDIIGCVSSQTMREASQRMVKHDISQIPVFEDDRVVGSLTERGIIEAQTKYGAEEAFNMHVSKVMGPPFPIVDASTLRSTLYSILHHYQAVVVTKKGKVIGIVSRADLLRK